MMINSDCRSNGKRRSANRDDSATLLFKNIGHDDFMAGAGESLGRCATDADAGACNEDCLAHSITSPELGPIVCPTNRLA